MPTLLELFKDEYPHWYAIMSSFKFHFYLNLPLNVLQEFNKLNIKFQYDMVDIKTISATIDITIFISSRHFFIQEWTYVWSYKQKIQKKIEGIFSWVMKTI
jgi:hypothetical protein